MSNSTNESTNESRAATLLQFNATVFVGIFLFLTLGARGGPAFIIISTMFPFIVSAALCLVFRRIRVGRSDEINNPFVANTLPISEWMTIIGTIYLVGVLTIILVGYPGGFDSTTTIVINGSTRVLSSNALL